MSYSLLYNIVQRMTLRNNSSYHWCSSYQCSATSSMYVHNHWNRKSHNYKAFHQDHIDRWKRWPSNHHVSLTMIVSRIGHNYWTSKFHYRHLVNNIDRWMTWILTIGNYYRLHLIVAMYGRSRQNKRFHFPIV